MDSLIKVRQEKGLTEELSLVHRDPEQQYLTVFLLYVCNSGTKAGAGKL